MQVKSPLLLVAAQCLLSLPLCAQNTPAIPAAEQGLKEIDLETKISAPQITSWPNTLSWQKAPDGVGEFLAYPNPPEQEEFVWGTQRLRGTVEGLLSCDADGKWRIVPGLYKHLVRIIGESQDMLWVGQDDDGVLALNQNLEVVRRIPSVKGRCIAVDAGGFWCLHDTGFQNTFGMRSGILLKSRTLVEYDLNGAEKRRFTPKELELVPAVPPREEESGNDGIGWAAVDEKAVWVELNNYSWTPPLPTHPPIRKGQQQLGRLDRATGKWTSFSQTLEKSLPDKTQLINLPNSIQWLEGVDFKTQDVYQLDKQTLQISRVMRIAGVGYDDIKTLGNNLWIRNRTKETFDRAKVYSRETFAPIGIDKIASASGMLFEDRPNAWDYYKPIWAGILGDDENGLWLGAPQRRLLHVGDDGKDKAYDITSVLQSTSSPLISDTPSGQFLWSDAEQLTSIQADGQAKQILLGGQWAEEQGQLSETPYLSFLATNRQRTWYQTKNGKIVTLATNLSNPREITPKRSIRAMIAVGDVLYAWDGNGRLLCIDGQTGKEREIESWARYTKNDEKRSQLKWESQSAFALPDGRIAFVFWGNRGWYWNGKDQVLIFDPIKDTWQENAASISAKPLMAGKKLYGYDMMKFYEWRGDNWVVIGEHQFSKFLREFMIEPGQLTEPRVASTEKYFYRETNLGLFRVPWAQIGGG